MKVMTEWYNADHFYPSLIGRYLCSDSYCIQDHCSMYFLYWDGQGWRNTVMLPVEPPFSWRGLAFDPDSSTTVFGDEPDQKLLFLIVEDFL